MWWLWHRDVHRCVWAGSFTSLLLQSIVPLSGQFGPKDSNNNNIQQPNPPKRTFSGAPFAMHVRNQRSKPIGELTPLKLHLRQRYRHIAEYWIMSLGGQYAMRISSKWVYT
ncbi:hypothetical protein FN846DRAFT_264934 [Sphaerosporella brunnea]|uniref:Secreted protein n=1 Tax=Sphaerosporella brunnea TaxID=1250544 RepID=A0A5J5ELN6_9PEZI|nr:hypothetical protein FN846DRAFT_264934 [Sphaerosporella brunnea]